MGISTAARLERVKSGGSIVALLVLVVAVGRVLRYTQRFALFALLRQILILIFLAGGVSLLRNCSITHALSFFFVIIRTFFAINLGHGLAHRVEVKPCGFFS